MHLDQTTCHHAVRALVTSRLDYANSLLYGINASDMKRLQRLQNRAAKIIFKAKKHDHASPLLQQLHWLPVHSRIIFKLLTVIYKCFTNQAPMYLAELIIPYKSGRSGLRSGSDNRLVTIPKTNTSSWDKGFYSAGPMLWNNLPYHIRHAVSLSSFKKELKSYLFSK